MTENLITGTIKVYRERPLTKIWFNTYFSLWISLFLRTFFAKVAHQISKKCFIEFKDDSAKSSEKNKLYSFLFPLSIISEYEMSSIKCWQLIHKYYSGKMLYFLVYVNLSLKCIFWFRCRFKPLEPNPNKFCSSWG